MEQDFFIKIYIRIMSITPIKQIILIHKFNFDEKSWSDSRNLMKKATKRVIPKILYKLVKILYLLFYDNKIISIVIIYNYKIKHKIIFILL